MNKIKNNKLLSIIAIAIAYSVALIVGLLVWKIDINVNFYIKVLISDICATAVIFIFNLIFKNASVYDPYWSVQPMVIVFLILVNQVSVGVADILIIALIEIWGFRLTYNWAYTFKDLTAQDWRYVNIKNKTGKAYQIVNFLGIEMMPTLIVYACMLPILAFSQKEREFSWFALIGVIIAIIGILLELIADFQKHSFKKTNNSGLMKTGLWKRHRHPNYIGEISFWWGIYFIVLAVNPSLWWTFVGALANTLLFLFISIPLAEKNSEKRHEEEWKEYKKNSFYL